jgi:hypothetical protein
MSDRTKWTWEQMLDAFRALGGVAENVRIGTGPRGRGLFPVDPAHEVRIHAPPQLLVDVGDVVLEDGHAVVRQEADVSPQVRAFFARYQRDFSFGAGAADDCRRNLEALSELPGDVQDYIFGGQTSRRRYEKPTDQAILQEYIDTRKVTISARRGNRVAEVPQAAPGEASAPPPKRLVLMPVVELVNHSGQFPLFDLSEGAGVSGRFPEEILARYNVRDAWDIFMSFHFASETVLSYSRGMDIGIAGGRVLRVNDDPWSVRMTDGVGIPVVELKGAVIEASHAMLGNRMAPGFPRWAFRRALRDCGVQNLDELFDVLLQANRSWFLGLLALIENRSGAMIGQMRQAVAMQLETMSFVVGANFVPWKKV